VSSDEERLEGWERWEQHAYSLLPYPLLAISIVASGVDQHVSRDHFLWSLVVSAAVIGWMWFGVPPGDDDSRRPTPGSARAIAFVVGQLAFTALLILLSGWYGFFAFSNYLIGFALLLDRWRFLVCVVNAALVAFTYTGWPHSGHTWVAWGILFLVISVLACTFGFFGLAENERTGRHRKIIAELEEANRRLEAALDENAGLQAQLLVQAREAGALDERARMAREIHDTLAQGLAGIVTQLEAADVPNDHVATAVQLARESLTEARRSVAGLAPRELADGRLPTAIGDAARRWSQRSGIEVSVETTGDPQPLIADVELALFRVCQESLTNIAKHADAARVGITLSYMDDVVTLDVRDDGVGFAPGRSQQAKVSSGYGLPGMRQRVQRVAGTLEVESAPGEGTAISANVPAIPATAEEVAR
jgi:signal transduction histidine kinase